MVDWDMVEKRLHKGWEWSRIAEDPKVGFQAEEGAGDPGRALKTLYYQRRSRAQRRSGDSDDTVGGPGGGKAPVSRLTQVGWLLTPLIGIWLAVALAYPSLLGTVVPAVPYLALAFVAAVALLAVALLRSLDRWNRTFRTTLVVGLVLGVAISGGIGAYSISQGCPILTTSTTSEPLGWQKAGNPEWTESGAPVFFFYGSIACPYCSASSWAMYYALQQFGTLSGTSFGHSNPGDVYPNTPEVNLASANLQSQYVALDVLEGTNDNQINEPTPSTCTESAYVQTYDSCSTCGIPFLVLGGKYVHTGTLVDPGQLRSPPGDATGAPLNTTQVQQQVQAQSGAAWNAISSEMYMLEALLVVLNHGQPASLASNPNVAPYIHQIS